MIKQLFLPLIGVAAFIVLVGLLVKNPQKFGFINATPTPTLKEIKVGSKAMKVTLADSSEERAKGLSGVSSLPKDQGMLFVFEKKDTYPSFWMKGMIMPIDIIWVNDGKIVKIDKNITAPPAGTADKDLKLYRPDKPIDYVLEVAGGFSDKNGLTVGQSLSGL